MVGTGRVRALLALDGVVDNETPTEIPLVFRICTSDGLVADLSAAFASFSATDTGVSGGWTTFMCLGSVVHLVMAISALGVAISIELVVCNVSVVSAISTEALVVFWAWN